MQTLARFDTRLLHALNGLAGRSAFLDALMIACAKYAPLVFVVVLAVLWLSWRTWYQRTAAIAAIGALVALGVGQIVGMALPRVRPYEAQQAQPVHLLVAHSPDTSFPSDHTTLAFAITVALWHADRRWGIASLVFSVWLAVARVYIGAHYPSDVLGGAALGSVVSAGVLWLSERPLIESAITAALRLLHRAHVAADPGLREPAVRSGHAEV